MALTPPLPLSQQTSWHSNTTRKSYHIRRESAVLIPKAAGRLRSHTDTDEYHAHCAENANRYKRSGNKSRKKTRTFESHNIKYNDNDTNQFPYHQRSKQTNEYIDHYNYKHEIEDLLQQFRDIVVPLQTEIKSLRKITKELQDQVHILQQENDIYRKYRYNDSNQASYMDEYYDHSPNALNINAPVFPLTLNSSLSVNPAYLFMISPQSKRTRTISNATISRPHKSKHIAQSDNPKQTRTISQEMEEHALEIGSALKSIDNHKIHMINNEDVSVNIDISEMDHLLQTPETVSSVGSIEKTYHYAPSLSDPGPQSSLPSPTPVSSISTVPINALLNTSVSVKLYKTYFKRNSKRNSSNVTFV